MDLLLFCIINLPCIPTASLKFHLEDAYFIPVSPYGSCYNITYCTKYATCLYGGQEAWSIECKENGQPTCVFWCTELTSLSRSHSLDKDCWIGFTNGNTQARITQWKKSLGDTEAVKVSLTNGVKTWPFVLFELSPSRFLFGEFFMFSSTY